MAYQLTPLSQLSLTVLTGYYNHIQERSPGGWKTSEQELEERIRVYDIDLKKSLCCLRDGEVLALIFFGQRNEHGWLSIHGLTADNEHLFITMIHQILDKCRDLAHVATEIILGDEVPFQLFKSLGFQAFRTLETLIRNTSSGLTVGAGGIRELSRVEVLNCLKQRESYQSWKEKSQSLAKLEHFEGFKGTLPSGGSGWLLYQEEEGKLSHLTIEVTSGNPEEVSDFLLGQLHRKFPTHFSCIDYLSTDSPYHASFLKHQYRLIALKLELTKPIKVAKTEPLVMAEALAL